MKPGHISAAQMMTTFDRLMGHSRSIGVYLVGVAGYVCDEKRGVVVLAGYFPTHPFVGANLNYRKRK